MKHIALLFVSILFVYGCTEETPTPAPPAPPVYDPTPYVIDMTTLPAGTDMVPLPTDWPLTKQRVLLGRMMFHDPALSRDGTQSCASCHVQGDGFTDLRRFSIGIKGLPGTRQSMPLSNLAWHKNGFFWDGRAPRLREQALRPILDPIEMNNTMAGLEATLNASQTYRDQFTRAFESDTISYVEIGVALEQYMFTLISGNSKFDKVFRGETTFTEQEERGRLLFFREFDVTGKKKGAECFHCHGGPNFTNDRYMNNGLDDDASFVDLGRALVTKRATDNAKFKTPSLRNIAVTPPYMHDGRFSTLEQVVDHYNGGAKQSTTVDPLMQFLLNPGLKLTSDDKADLIAFLKTLTDQTFLTNPAYAKP